MIHCEQCDEPIKRHVFCSRKCKDNFHNTNGVKKEPRTAKSTPTVLNNVRGASLGWDKSKNQCFRHKLKTCTLCPK